MEVTFKPDLIDFYGVSSTHTRCKTGIARKTLNNNILLQHYEFFEMCFQLNGKQQYNVMMGYPIKCCLAGKYDELVPDAFHIFLNDGAGVGKSFLVKAITEYLIRIIKHHNQ